MIGCSLLLQHPYSTSGWLVTNKAFGPDECLLSCHALSRDNESKVLTQIQQSPDCVGVKTPVQQATCLIHLCCLVQVHLTKGTRWDAENAEKSCVEGWLAGDEG